MTAVGIDVGKASLDLIADPGEEAAQPGRPPVQLGRAGLHRVLAHQPFDPPSTDALTLTTQLGMHPRGAVGLPTGPVYLADALNQARVLLGTLAGRPIAPRVVAAGADAKQTARRLTG